MDTRGKTAVVTGASRGIGEGLVRAFLERDMFVAACARGEAPLEHDRLLYRRLDVTSREDVFAFGDAARSRFGRVDLWINNAGVLDPIGPLRDLDAREFEALLRTNVMGVFHGSQWFVRHVRSREGGGVLLNISSGAAWTGYAGWSAYCASKAAVDRMSECVQLEERDQGLRVHAVAPGIVDTYMQERIRGCSKEQFPMVDKFLEFKREDAFNSPGFVAERLLEIAFSPAHAPAEVVVRLPSEKA